VTSRAPLRRLPLDFAHVLLLAWCAACTSTVQWLAATRVLAQHESPASAGSEAPPTSGASEPRGTDRIAIADALFVSARGLMQEQRYSEACAKFQESYRLDPASGTLLNLAVCHEHEGKLASAWAEFRAALQEAVAAQRADRIQLAREHAEALAEQIPYLALEVPVAARVPGLEIVRNGVPTLEAAWTEALPVDPGRVRIEVRAPGYRTEIREVTVAPGQHLTVNVPVLQRVRAADPALTLAGAPASTARPRTNGPAAPARRRWASLSLLAASAAVTAGGIAAGVVTLHEKSRSDDACPELDGERRCSQAGVDAMTSARRWARASDITIGLGIVGLAAGTYLLIAAPGDEQTDRARAASSTGRHWRHASGSRWSWDLNVGARGARGVLARSF
jgi:hypothetical protein